MRTETKKRAARNERGVALIIALLALLVLSVLTAGIIFVTQTEIWTTANYRELAQARYAAEAGVQSTINWLQYTYTPPTTSQQSSYTMTTAPVKYNGSPVVLSGISSISSNYPDANQQGLYYSALYNQALVAPGLSNASYSTSATLLSMNPVSGVAWLGTNGGVMQIWQITSQGSVSGVRKATVQVVATFQKTALPIFSAPVVATATGCTVSGCTGSMCAPIYFNGACKTNTGATGPCTDSYNSNSGPYSTTNSSTSGGNIASNGLVNLNGAAIDGTIYSSLSTKVGNSCPTDGVETGSGGTYGSIGSVPAITEPCPWGCSSCGATACYPPGVTPVTSTQTLNSTLCPASGVNGCTPGCTLPGCSAAQNTATMKLYDGTNTGTTAVNQYSLAPGTYGNITWSTSGADKDAVLYVQGGGTYNINALNFGSNNGQIVVVGSGSVTLNITGAGTLPSEGGASGNVPSAIYEAGLGGFNLCNNGLPGNPGQLYPSGSTLGANCNNAATGSPGPGNPTANPISGIPGNMQIVYAGTGQMRVGGAPNALVIYMPNAPFYQPGGAVGLNGSIVSKSFVDDSNSPFHYDSALQSSSSKVGPYQLIGFSWSKF